MTHKSKSFRDQYSIRQGRITLYRRTHQGSEYQSDNWYAYLKIPKQKAIRKSLKTTDRDEAESLAESLFFDLTEKSKRGLSLKSKRFELIARRYIDDFEANAEREKDAPLHLRSYKPALLKNKKTIVQKYLVVFFAEKTIQEITDFDVESYKHWRKNYWISGLGSEVTEITYTRKGHKITRPKSIREKREPHHSTINKELTVLREIFDFARMSRIIEGREIPSITNLKKPKLEQPKKSGLSETEVKHLLKTLVDRYRNEPNSKHKRHLKLLIHFVSFMCLTGMRYSEAKQVKFSDCESHTKGDADYLKIFVRAKGKSRELIGLHESATTLEKLRIYHLENAETNEWQFNDDTYVFTDQYGNRVNSFSKSLNRALSDADLLFDKHGTKRNAGAFRKYYINSALMSGVNYFELAKQCGTSVTVIEQFYAQIETWNKPEKFIFSHALSGIYDDNPPQPRPESS